MSDIKSLNIKKWILVTLVVSSSVLAHAMSIDWNGTYRFEMVEVDRTSLGTPGDRKSYGLNYLSLSPKIIASDGVNITSKFLILSNNEDSYLNTQMGQLWGAGLSQKDNQSNALSNNKPYSPLQISQLYLNINQEYGSLLVGRAPFEFGLGITHSAGNGLFDHWADIHDIAAYKIVVGNVYFMPAFGRVYDQDAGQGNGIGEQIIQILYQNDEAGSLIGYNRVDRKGSPVFNDINKNNFFNGSSVSGGVSSQVTNFVLGRKWEPVEFKIEAGYTSGETGLTAADGSEVKLNGYGVAAELYFPNRESKWNYNFRLGAATGDDPVTSSYEGFSFNRNYDVSFLLFNHRLGKVDILSTNLIKDQSRDNSNSYDDEAIGNAMYISPLIGYKWSEQLDIFNSLTYAQVMKNSTQATGFQKDLGFEWDFKIVYKPTSRIQWVNQLGFLFPGAAFKNGENNLSNSMTYGFETKAAISF